MALPTDDTAGPAAEPEGNGNDNGSPSGGSNGHSEVQSKDKAIAEAKAGAAAKAEIQPATAALTDTPPVRPARMQGLELGPACDQCGGMMQRTGSCYTCSSCGNNTGCG